MRKVEAFASHRSNKFYVGIIINKALKMCVCVFSLLSLLFCIALHCIAFRGMGLWATVLVYHRDQIKATEKLYYTKCTVAT